MSELNLVPSGNSTRRETDSNNFVETLAMKVQLPPSQTPIKMSLNNPVKTT